MEIMQGPQPALAPAAPQVAGPAPVQFEQASGGAAAYGQSAELNGIQRKAAAGVAGAGGGLPHAAAIQASFGHHDVSGVEAHVGGAAAQVSEELGASAYATGNAVAFKSTPDLHLAAHEAAHVVQQRGGVQLKGGVGQVGDPHERHADAVADRVVQGKSAVDLLDQYTGGTASAPGVQRACDCGGCPACEAKERAKQAGQGDAAPAEAPVQRQVQFNILDDARQAVSDTVDGVRQAASDAYDSARQTVSDAVDAVVEWIDLLGPKGALLDKIRNGQWIIDAVNQVMDAHDPHPEHSLAMKAELVLVGAGAGAEAFGYAMRIADCDDLAAVEALEAEYDAWRADRPATLTEELEAKVEEYRDIERGWVANFLASPQINKDPANLNKSGQKANLCFQPGNPSTVTVETRVNCTFGRTANALADNDGDGQPDVADWTDDEKAHFLTRFQEQLDHVWTTGAGAVAPFRASEPADHLLETDPVRWSELTAVMAAKVTADTANPHFNLNVDKKASNENPRAFVNNGGGHFYLNNAEAGYHQTGPDAGTPNGRQMTLAHEWHHMIGNPDEYAENSASQDASTSTPADLRNRWGTCQAHFNTIINDATKPQAERDQAAADLQALQNHATDMDPSTPGFQAGIFDVASRPDIPDECFAIRGSWRPTDGRQQLLRPGAQSQRGGSHISASADDAARLSDRGNTVRPYMREGIVDELRTLLQGAYTPEVQFDHNFKEMTPEELVETITVRVQNILVDQQVAMGSSRAPSGDGEAPDTHDHDHDDGDGHDH